MATRVLMAEVSGELVRGRPRLGWMDGWNDGGGCAKYRREWRALVHM